MLLSEEELKVAFSNVGLKNITDEMLSKCVSLGNTQGISSKQLANVWEAFSINKNIEKLTDHCYAGYRKQVLKDYGDNEDSVVVTRLSQKRTTATFVTPPPVTPPPAKRQVPNDKSTVDRITSHGITTTPSKVTVLNYKSYDDRQGVGKIVASYRPKKELQDIKRENGGTRCEISDAFETNTTDAYRHMNFPLEDRAKILEDQMVKIGEAIVSQYKGDAEFEAVGVPRQDKVLCLGRICNEAHEGRLNATTLMLEGSKVSSNGARVHLDLSDMDKPYSLFPGQIVAVEGIDATGRKLVASNIYQGFAPQPEQKVGEKNQLQIMAVSGPFTTSDNLDYAPIQDLLQIVASSKPDVVILTGPFVDIEQDCMDTELEIDGQPVTYEVLFSLKIANLLEELFDVEDNLSTQFVLIPSLRDAISEWVFPQAPFANNEKSSFLKLKGAEGIEFGTLGLEHVETVNRKVQKGKRIHCFSNPCTFKINNIVVGITSHDVLMDLSAEETNRNLVPGTRLVRIAEHLIQQRCYYPLFPASNINLNLQKFEQIQMPCRPDLLIVPSKLAPMAKSINESSMIVNPGYLSKGTTGGTYATMNIHQHSENDNLADHITIDIKKI